MPVRIRLRRVGRKKQPSYRIVVAESSNPRGGVYLDNVGFYNPRREPLELRVDLEKVDDWVGRGATIDRKSTRLNSSHVANSYAVFCLKKKNEMSQQAKHGPQGGK